MNSKENITKEKEIIPESFKEVKADIEKGDSGYLIVTKTNVGEEFKGYTRKKEDDFREYFTASKEPSKQDITDQLKMWGKHSPGIRSLINFMQLDKFGNAAILISFPSFKKELTDRIREELCRFSIGYHNDYSKFSDPRSNTTNIDFLIKKRIAEEIINNIKENPDNLLKFIKYLEPELLDVAPISDKSYYAKAEGIAIFKEDKPGKLDEYRAEPIEVLPWKNKAEPQKSHEGFAKDADDESNKKEDVANLQMEDEKKSEKEITEIRAEIKKEKPKSKNLESKEEFIIARLYGVLDGALATGKIPYELPKGLYTIEKKGFFSRKYIVKTYGEINKEFENREEADIFVEKKKKERAVKDLGDIWERLRIENET